MYDELTAKRHRMNEDKRFTAETAPPLSGPRLRKIIVPFDEEGPMAQPLFVNFCQVAYHDTIAYIDLGVIPVDEFVGTTSPDEVTFAVQNRIVMGVPTLKLLRDQILNLLAQVDKTNDPTSANTQAP